MFYGKCEFRVGAKKTKKQKKIPWVLVLENWKVVKATG